MRINISLSLIVFALTLYLGVSAQAFQGRLPGGPGFTGSPGGGFTGPRGGGFTDTLSPTRGAESGVGLNLLEFIRMRRGGSPQISGNPNGNRPNAANSRNRGNTAKNADPANALNPANVNRQGIAWNNPYARYHQEWVHGYWTGRYPGGLGWRTIGYPYPGFQGAGVGDGPGYGLIMGRGWGLSPWLYGPMLYQYGYSPYFNPYHAASTTVGEASVSYDYGQPINAQRTLPPKLATDKAVSTFNSARQAFKREDYPSALILVDHALKLTPSDPTMHEFRALTLFALRRGDQAAEALYAVLSVKPGWDWMTLISLYGDPARYTEQLRAFEAYSTQTPRSAQTHFVLAYHYLTQEFAEAAVGQFKLATALEPKDTLSAQLIQQIEHPAHTVASTGLAQPAGFAGAVSGRNGGRIEGTWIARRSNDVDVIVNFQDNDRFVWKVRDRGKDREFQGKSTERDGIVTLVDDENQEAIVGSLNWTGENHLVFKVIGAVPGDPGLSFTRSSED
jgi:tetratricopeptide (TPR) repeat protein